MISRNRGNKMPRSAKAELQIVKSMRMFAPRWERIFGEAHEEREGGEDKERRAHAKGRRHVAVQLNRIDAALLHVGRSFINSRFTTIGGGGLIQPGESVSLGSWPRIRTICRFEAKLMSKDIDSSGGWVSNRLVRPFGAFNSGAHDAGNCYLCRFVCPPRRPQKTQP